MTPPTPQALCACGVLVVETPRGVRHVRDRCRYCPPAGPCPEADWHGRGACTDPMVLACSHYRCPRDAVPGAEPHCQRGMPSCCGCCQEDDYTQEER